MEADFERYYQRDIADLWRRRKNGKPKLTTRKAAILLCHLPRGAQVWLHAGGGMAVTEEVQEMYSLQHLIIMQSWAKAPKSKRGAKPKPREFPKPLFEEDEKRKRFERNAEAWRRKYGKPN